MYTPRPLHSDHITKGMISRRISKNVPNVVISFPSGHIEITIHFQSVENEFGFELFGNVLTCSVLVVNEDAVEISVEVSLNLEDFETPRKEIRVNRATLILNSTIDIIDSVKCELCEQCGGVVIGRAIEVAIRKSEWIEKTVFDEVLNLCFVRLVESENVDFWR